MAGEMLGLGVCICLRRCSAAAILRLRRVFVVMIRFLRGKEVAERPIVKVGTSPIAEEVAVSATPEVRLFVEVFDGE